MKIVLATYGTRGDVFPYVEIARELKARGHAPLLLAPTPFREEIEQNGLEFRPLRPQWPDDPTIWARLMDAMQGPDFLFRRLLLPNVRAMFDDLMGALEGAEALVSHTLVLAAPLGAQKSGVAWISGVVSPLLFFSQADNPTLPVAPNLRDRAPALNRRILALVERQIGAQLKPIHDLRRELGLRRGRNPLKHDIHAPSRVLALFSAHFTPLAPDFPSQTRAVGFCWPHEENLRPELAVWLENGPPPVVFLVASFAAHAEQFWQTNREIARNLGTRALFLGAPNEEISPDIYAARFAPLGAVLKHARAAAHHGGLGAIALCLRAGVPMLLTPHAHDQPDNARRARDLGAACVLALKNYNAASGTRELGAILENDVLSKGAQKIGALLRAENGAQAACDEILASIQSQNSSNIGPMGESQIANGARVS